ncbi:MAG: isoprenyl transferase [Marinifilaceae bacterium]
MELGINKIDLQRVPKHIAIIMDGNGRWAKARGEKRIVGHQHGVDALRTAVEASIDTGVQFLTVYAFSMENWARPKEEVDGLMELMVEAITAEIENLQEQDVRLAVIGDMSKLPLKVRNKLQESIDNTSENKGLCFVLALNYSSRWEILEATKILAQKVKENIIEIDDINEDIFASCLNTNNIPDPELLIRTSGESRLSNFLLWQVAYTEFYFIDKFWPDFKKEDLYLAIYNYQKRERRFGKTSEQL